MSGYQITDEIEVLREEFEKWSAKNR